MLDKPVAVAHPNKIRLIGGDKIAAISRDMVAIPVKILIASKCYFVFIICFSTIINKSFYYSII
jgi:hypothetical protein